MKLRILTLAMAVISTAASWGRPSRERKTYTQPFTEPLPMPQALW